MTNVPNDPLIDYEFPMRIGGGELGTPGSGYMARDAWALFLAALVEHIPDALPDLLSDETLRVARRCGTDPLRRPSPYLDRDHDLWGCVRRWCSAMNIAFAKDDAFVVACKSVENTIFRAVRASKDGQPLPANFVEPMRIFTIMQSINDDGTIESGTDTALTPQFLEPAVASHLFRWAMEIEPEERALKRMLKDVEADLVRAMAEAKAKGLATGMAPVVVKVEQAHFEWVVRAVVRNDPYLRIARDVKSDLKNVKRRVRELCALLGIYPPQNGPGRRKN